MHPDIQKENPGLCPECGMNLIESKSKRKKKGTKHVPNVFVLKFWVSFILSIPVVLYSDIVQTLFSWQPPAFPGSRYIPFFLGSIIFFYGGWIFIASAWRELRAKLPGMMTLITLAILTAYIYSVYVTIVGRGNTLFWELATLITVMLLGHWIEMRAVQGAQGALRELSKLLPDTAEVVRGGKTAIIPLNKLKVSDVVFVRPGAKIPTDGIIVEGKSEVDESMVTGESAPVMKNIGNETIAGTLNGDGSLKIKVTKIGEHTFLAGVVRLVAEAQASKSRLQVLSDRAAFYLTIIAIVSGVAAFGSWIFFSERDFAFAIERLVAVLVIACPHALGLAIPLVSSISTTLAAKNGFLIRQRLSLEAARNIDVVLFDKTGTLTKGEYGVEKIIANGSETNDKLLQLAASVDSHSEHFISKAIVKAAEDKGLTILEVKNFQRVPGKGVNGDVQGNSVLVGGEAILGEAKIKVPGEIKLKIKKLTKQRETIVYVISNKKLMGIISLSDIIRDESREAISELKALGIKTAMVTGDSYDVAERIASELGIDEYFAKVLPGEKAEKVRILQSKGLKVAMVGDGINDAPALTQADLGIAIGAGTNVAIESAGIILVRNDPRDITTIIRLSRATYSKMVQNLFWATGYNVIALPLAAGVFVSQGIILQPALAALLMSLSTVIVAVNAMLLRWRGLKR